MKDKICELATYFGLEGQVESVDVVSNGHINSTYDVMMSHNGENHRYIFQKLNIFVFKNPKKIMGNIARITNHISDKLAEMGEITAESFDIIIPDVLAGKAEARTNPKDRIYAQIIGTGMLDVACAGLVLQRIVQSGEDVFRFDMTK